MKEIYHYHLTIADVTSAQLKIIAKKLKAKPTEIDLYNDQLSQKDRMITKYANNYETIRMNSLFDKLRISDWGFEVVRTKIEQVMDHFHYNVLSAYSEVHCKIKDGSNLHQKFKYLKRSNNSLDGARFLNGRASLMIQRDLIREELKLVEDVISTQYEICWYDSNISHDKWWS